MVTTEFEQLRQGERTLDGSQDDGKDERAAERVDRRQLLLVACCLGAVLVAAVLAPTPVESDASAPEPTGTPAPPRDGGGGDADDSGGDSRVVGDGGDPIPVPDGTAPPTKGCGVLLEDEPIPGTRATVAVFRDTDPVAGVPVDFNGEPVGRTDERGRVSGPVPYNRTLAVSVDLDADCEFYREQFDGRSDAAATDGETRDGTERSGLAPRRSEGGRAVSRRDAVEFAADIAGQSGAAVAQSASAIQSRNATGEYAVRGDVDLTVRGDAYPGNTVTVLASIEGVPMREATVTLAGSTVGRTDGDGGVNVTVPDGRQAIPVAVSRGDFSGSDAVDVLLLTAAVEPQEGFPVPGERAAVVARVDERPTGDVSVRVADRRVGSTATDGRVGFRLPVSPAGSVVASTRRQSATVPLWNLYLPTVLNLLALLAAGAVATGGTRLLRGADAAARVAVGWVALAVADVALVVGEWPGLALALLGLAVVGTVHQRRRVRAGGERAAGTAARVVMGVRRAALWVTDLVARVLDRARRLLGQTWTRLTSFERFTALLAGVAHRAVATAWLYLTLRRVGVAAFALGELAVATARWGHEGLVASVAGLAVVAVLVALWRRDGAVATPVDPDGESAVTGEPARRTVERDAGGSEARMRSIRELWRQFARWVVPGSWRTRTPGEVARAAVDRGFPREPVETLTDAFREVEYGSESQTERRERAKNAFDSLATANEEDDE